MKPWSFDSPIMEKLGLVGDIIILNFIYLLSCLPIITIGAANSSLYFVTMKMVRGENVQILREYFMALKKNFRIGALSGLMILTAGILIWVDFHLISVLNDSTKTIFGFVLGLILAAVILISTYIFPYIARFETNLKTVFKDSLFLSISQFPLTLLLVGLNLGIVLLIIFSPRLFTIMLLIFTFFGFALFAYVKSKIYTKIFLKIIDKNSSAKLMSE